MKVEPRYYASHTWISRCAQLYRRSFVYFPKLLQLVNFLFILAQVAVFILCFVVDINVVYVMDGSPFSIRALLVFYIFSPFMVQYVLFVQPLTSHASTSSILYLYFLFPIGLLHTVYVNIKSWLLRILDGFTAFYQGFQPRKSERATKTEHILDFTEALFHSLPMILTVFCLLCALLLDDTTSQSQKNALANSIVVNAVRLFFTYFFIAQEKDSQLFDFFSFVAHLFLDYFEHIPTLNDVIVTSSSTLNLVGVELSERKITVLSDVIDEYQEIDTILLDQSSFLHMELMKDLWKIIRRKKIFFLKYQTGQHLLSAEANQNHFWTEEGFLRDLGTLDNWIWWENYVGPDIPLTKEGLVTLCFESRQYIPKMYVPITDVLLNNELMGHKEMAKLQELVWVEDFRKEKPETKIYRHSSSVDLASLNHTLLHDISFPNCNIISKMTCLNLPELRKLNLERTNFSRFELLTQLQNLHTLNLSHCERLNTKGVGEVFWPYLRRLHLSGSNFDRLELLSDLTSLETVDFSYCKNLLSIPGMQMKWTRLIDLDLSASNFSDLSSIIDMPLVQSVDISKCKELTTKEMKEALNWPNCETINMDHSNFDNLELMSSMRSLLYFSANHCAEIYTFSVSTFFWPHAEVLLLSGSSFDDMFLIHNLNSLETLDFSNCLHLHTRAFPSLYTLNLPRLKNLDLRGSSFDRLEILDNLPHLEHLKIFLCPNLCIADQSKYHWPNLKKLDMEMDHFLKLKISSQFMPKLEAYIDKKSKEIANAVDKADTHSLYLRASLSAGSFPASLTFPTTPIQSFVDTISERYVTEDAFTETDAYSCGNPAATQENGSFTNSITNSENMRVTFKEKSSNQSQSVRSRSNRSPDMDVKLPHMIFDMPIAHDEPVLFENGIPVFLHRAESDGGYSERKSDTAELQELLQGSIADDMQFVKHDPLDDLQLSEVEEVRITMEELLRSSSNRSRPHLESNTQSPVRSRSLPESKASEHSASRKSTPNNQSIPADALRDAKVELDSRAIKNEKSEFQPRLNHEDVDEKKSEYSEDFALSASRVPPTNKKDPTITKDTGFGEKRVEPAGDMYEADEDSLKDGSDDGMVILDPAPLPPPKEDDVKMNKNKSPIEKEEEEYIPTVPCRYFQEGRCTRGDQCTFLHVEPNTALPTTDVTKTKHCKFWRKGQCTKGNFCTFIHDPHSLMPLKTKVCKYHEAGLCLKGDHCTFVHVSQDKDAIIREIKSFVKLHQHGDKGALFVKLLQSMKFDHSRFGYKRAIDFVEAIPGILIERKPQVELFLDEHDDFLKPRRQQQTTPREASLSLRSEGETSTQDDLDSLLNRRPSSLPPSSSNNNLLAFFNNTPPLNMGMVHNNDFEISDQRHEFSRPPPRQQNYYQQPPHHPHAMHSYNFMMPFFPNNPSTGPPTYLPET